MERQTAEGVAPIAIEGVAENGVAAVGEVNPDLVFAAGFEADFDPGGVGGPFEDTAMGDGVFAAGGVRRDIDAMDAVFGETGVDGEGVRDDAALGDGEVGASGGVGLELILKAVLGGLGFGEDEEAGRLAVEAMDDEEAFGRTAAPEVVEEDGIEGAAFFVFGADGEESGGFIGDEEGAVFVENPDAIGQGGGVAIVVETG